MAEWLTSEWVEASHEALGSWPACATHGALRPVTVAVTVTGGPDGDVCYERRWWSPEPEGGEDRELAVTIPAPDARVILAGGLSPSVAYMRGRLKTSGDPSAALDVLAATADASFADALGRVRAITDVMDGP